MFWPGAGSLADGYFLESYTYITDIILIIYIVSDPKIGKAFTNTSATHLECNLKHHSLPLIMKNNRGNEGGFVLIRTTINTI